MSDHDDLLHERLRAIDPARLDQPPEPGSIRFNSIKEHAVRTDKTEQTHKTPSLSRGSQSGRARLLAVGAAVLVAVAVGAAALNLGSASGASADIRIAADATAGETDFRVTIVTEGHSFIPGGRADGEVDGTSMRLVAGDMEFIRIDETEWIGQNGSFQSQSAEDAFDPFGQASAAVIAAALESDDVSDRGEEDLDGVPTRHYAIGLDDSSRAALAEVPSSAQFWFVGAVEEEIPLDGSSEEPRRFGFLEDADHLDVWVADGLIHQISVTEGEASFTYTFFDFGDDITITAPE